MASWSSGKEPRSPRLPKMKSYQEIVLHIVDHLQKSDIESWLFIRENDVPPKHQELCSNETLYFFRYMKQKGIFTEENPEPLIEDLGKLKKYGLQRDVRTMFADLHAHQWPTSPSPKSGQLQSRSLSLPSAPSALRGGQSLGSASDSQIARFTSDPGALPEQLCFENPVEEPPRSELFNVQPSSMTKSAKSGQQQQSLDRRQPFSDPFNSSTPFGNEGDVNLRSQPLNVQPSSTTESAKSGQLSVPTPSGYQVEVKKTPHNLPNSQILNVQPSSTKASGQLEKIPDESDHSGDQSLTSVTSSLRSREPASDPNSQRQEEVLNVHPNSQYSTQSYSGAVKGHNGNVQSAQGVSNPQKPVFGQPVEHPLNVQPSSTPGSAQISEGIRQPSEEKYMTARASTSSAVQVIEEMNVCSGENLLYAQSSSTTESAQTSGQLQQSPGVPHLSPESRGYMSSDMEANEQMIRHITTQLLNTQPSSATESAQTSGQKHQFDTPRPEATCPVLNAEFEQLHITEKQRTESLPSDLSVASSLKSTETSPYDAEHPQVLAVPPSSQQSNLSARKRPKAWQSGNVQSDPDVSPNQKPCIVHPEDEPSVRSATALSSKVGDGQGGHSANYVTALQSQGLEHPVDDPSIDPRVSVTSIPGSDSIRPLQSQRCQPLGVQPSSTTGSTLSSRGAPQRIAVQHPSDDPSMGAGMEEDDEMIWIAKPSASQPTYAQKVSAQSTTLPGKPRQAWAPNSSLPSQSARVVPRQHPPKQLDLSVSQTSIASSKGRISFSQSEFRATSVERPLSLSSTEGTPTRQSGEYVKQYETERRIHEETHDQSLDDIMQEFSPEDSVKDGRSSISNSFEDIPNITDELAKVDLEDKQPEPIIKKKSEEEKEKDDEDEKEKDEKEWVSEDELDEVQNIPEAPCTTANIMPNVADEKNIIREEKKEELPSPSSDSDIGKFEASEGSWPALAVAQKLSEEKAKKEEEEAKIEYDPTTGIEKALYEKMVNFPETLSPHEHEQIKTQMMQHLQKKANPMKKNEPELPFDSEGRLSEYQKELGLPGLMGFNYIICAPSRTGKVLTAATICNHQRKVGIMKNDKKKPLKFLFVTPENRVKERHRRAFEEVFPQGSVIALDSTDKFREVFDQPSVSVVMLTGIRLSVALNDGDLKFVEVHTMIIDQCHLVASDHPGIGDVIRHYLLEKKLILARKAPKGAWTLGKPYGGISSVIGLSPHLGAGMRQFSRDNIVQQCGLLDSKGIRRVETVENLRALLETNKPPQMDTMLIAPPSSSSIKGTFRSVVEKIMGEIEEKFSILPDTPEEGEKKKLLHPPYGTEKYTEWVTPLFNDSKLCKDEEKYAPAMFLVKLNEVLMVNEDLRTKEAMAHLGEVQKLKVDQDYQGPSGTTCYKMVNEQRPELKRLAETDHASLTPKLMCLAQKLAQIYKDDATALGLVICRCPAVAKFLTKIIKESNITMAQNVIPKHLEAIGHYEDDEEMSRMIAQQRGIIDEFNGEGGVNLMISTDFEQVDLKLPECQFVIRYNVACDEIGTIHWSGRMKAKKGLCFLVTESGTMITDQEENKREALKDLEKHLKVLNEMDPKNWYDIVENKQLACLRNNAHRDFIVNFQRFARRATDYTLLCRNCRKFICNAHFLLKRGTHISCQDSSIKERFSVAGLTSPIRGSEDDTTGVLKCTGQKDGQPCQNKLGLAIDFKRQEIEEGYSLDAKGFYFSFMGGQRAEYVGQEFDSWDDVDFFIYAEERSDRRGRSGGGGDDDDDDMDDDDDNNRGGGWDGDDGKKKKMEESGASGGGGGRTRTTERPRSEETQMETETSAGTRRRRPYKDGDIDR